MEHRFSNFTTKPFRSPSIACCRLNVAMLNPGCVRHSPSLAQAKATYQCSSLHPSPTFLCDHIINCVGVTATSLKAAGLAAGKIGTTHRHGLLTVSVAACRLQCTTAVATTTINECNYHSDTILKNKNKTVRHPHLPPPLSLHLQRVAQKGVLATMLIVSSWMRFGRTTSSIAMVEAMAILRWEPVKAAVTADPLSSTLPCSQAWLRKRP